MTPAPVRTGTAEQLARIAWHRGLEAADPTELDSVALFLIGPGGSVQARLDLWENLRDDCLHLWHLITADWDDADLDELTDQQWDDLFLVDRHAEEAARHHITVNRLIGEIEGAIWRHRYTAAERERATRYDTAVMDVLGGAR